jgi:prepilin-type N-terminal cleavage/methylation domain-containing protein
MKNLLNKRKASGFTIIEVMIVLAIAGLIMVIVFIAVPQLQRNQRDNARQNIANRVKAEIETYAGNNQGLYPFKNSCTGGGATGEWCNFYTNYVGGGKVKIVDPSTGADVFNASNTPVGWTSATAGVPTAAGGWAVIYGASCNGEQVQKSGTYAGAAPATIRTFAVMIGLDRNNTVYCVDNG